VRKRVAFMVSRTDHCVPDLLWRDRRGELDMEVVIVISNHPDLADEVRPFAIPYFHIPAKTTGPRDHDHHLLTWPETMGPRLDCGSR
jgi:formyltetrahydrofolate deformylase